jgi:hypothetical protein
LHLIREWHGYETDFFSLLYLHNVIVCLLLAQILYSFPFFFFCQLFNIPVSIWYNKKNVECQSIFYVNVFDVKITEKIFWVSNKDNFLSQTTRDRDGISSNFLKFKTNQIEREVFISTRLSYNHPSIIKEVLEGETPWI